MLETLYAIIVIPLVLLVIFIIGLIVWAFLKTFNRDNALEYIGMILAIALAYFLYSL